MTDGGGAGTHADAPAGGAAAEPLLPINSSSAAKRHRPKVPPPGLKSAQTTRRPRPAAPGTAPRGRAYRTFGVGPVRVRLPDADSCAACVSTVADYAVYLLGPVLICLATAIICGLTYTFFVVILDMVAPGGPFTPRWLFHVSVVVFFLTNVIWNYVLCVCTSNKGPHYDRVVRELADATGFRYPETEAEVAQCKRDYREKMLERGRARRRQISGEQQRDQTREKEADASGKDGSSSAEASQGNVNAAVAGAATATGGEVAGRSSASSSVPKEGGSSADGGAPTRIFSWMLMSPDEWGFCLNSNQPKPPRSHYDHVTKMLVLNMDHYCPWMFNTGKYFSKMSLSELIHPRHFRFVCHLLTPFLFRSWVAVGYFNYRYFCNFLFYVFTGMLYGTFISFQPFREISSPDYYKQIQMNRTEGYKTYRHLIRNVPLPSERTPIAFSFMICLSVGIAVFCLAAFHLYLLLTAQTTIEFHGNWGKRRKARQRGRTWINPYDLGKRRNWQQVYGSKHPIAALLPSGREPEFFPLPIAGEKGRRQRPKKEHFDSSLEVSCGDVECSDNGEKNEKISRSGLAHLV